MRDLVHDLIVDNPCLPPGSGPLARSLRIRSWPASTAIVAIIVILVYICLVALAVQSVTWFEPTLFLFAMLVVSMLLVAAVLYAGLAGEREKKSLDLILVAPVTSAQIVAAKLTRALLPLVASVLALVIPAIVIGVIRIFHGQPAIYNVSNFAGAVVGALALTLSTSVMIAGIAMYMSALNRSMSSALTATIGSLFALYVVMAVLGSSLATVSKDAADIVLSYHPFVAMSALFSSNTGSLPAVLTVSFSCVFHIVGGAALLVASVRSLDQERKKGGRSNA